MNFGSNNNNQRDAVNVNTRGLQMANREGFQPSTLVLGFWNDMISIKVHPALEASKQTDSKIFDYEQVFSTAITLEKAGVLIDKIENDLLPAITEKKEVFKGVSVGGDSLIGVGTKVQDDSVITYFAVFKKLDETTKQPDSSIYYEFKTTYTVDDYNPETGSFTITQGVQSEINLFLSFLKAAQIGLSNTVAHSVRHVDKFFRDRQMNQLDEIGGKLGIETKGRNNYGGGSFKTKNIWSSDGNQKSASKDLDDTQVEKLSNIDSINEFIS